MNKIKTDSQLEITSLTADIVAAYVTNNVISGERLPDFIVSVYAALRKASVQGIEPPKVELIPAVPVKKSVTPDYIICLEDGKKFKSLKRHLRTYYGLTPDEYREKWGLARDYPMVAPAYAAVRSHMAKNIGLGQHRKTKAPGRPAPAASSTPAGKAAKTGTKRRRLNGPALI
jgi:predicted transcriptional regulator